MISKKIGTIALAATALVALGCSSGFPDPDKEGGTWEGARSASPGTSTSVSVSPSVSASASYPVTAKDIKLTVKVLERQCFGSAGCNVQFRINTLTYTVDLDPEATYEVTYSYKGLEDPVENRLTLDGSTGRYEFEETEFGQTANRSAKITAVVTGVEKM